MVHFVPVFSFLSLYGQEVMCLMVEMCGPRAPCSMYPGQLRGPPSAWLYLCEVNLNLIFSICSLSNAAGESQVHFVELIPHLVGCHHQQVLDVVS